MPVIEPRLTCEIPTTDLTTWLFQSPTAPLVKEPVYIQTDKTETHKLTMHDYRGLTLRLAKGLQEAGVKDGDRILVFAGNNLYYPVLFMGVVTSGGIFSGANPSLTAREVAFQLKDTGAKFVIAGKDQLDIALQATEELKFPKQNVFLFDDSLLPLDGGIAWKGWPYTLRKYRSMGLRHWHELISRGAEDFQWKVFTTLEEANRTATINYSSGTTGVPKGVEISHYNLIANCEQVCFATEMGSRNGESEIAMLPMYHAYGQTLNIMICPKRGSVSYIMPKFDFVQYLACIQKFKITSIATVPPIILALCKHPIVKKFDLSSVEKVTCGAAPLSAELAREVQKIFKTKPKVKQGYGMTEATCNITFAPPEEPGQPATPESSVGMLMPNNFGKVMDVETGTKEMPIGEEGEMWFKGPNVCKGYYKNEAATRETITPDGWLKTGDIGKVDENGFWYIVDRKKELIKVKGNQVAPAELEGILLEHPKIADAAVIGIPFAGDERPRAYIVPNPGQNIEKDEVLEFVKSRAAPHKWITGGVVFLDAIPKNPSGKILRKILRERAKTEVVDTGDVKAKL